LKLVRNSAIWALVAVSLQANYNNRGAHMHTREDWLTHQIQLCELQVRNERQRLEKEMQRKAQEALIALSLPELLGEVSVPQNADEQGDCEPVAARMH
jgi:hypothetical protein